MPRYPFVGHRKKAPKPRTSLEPSLIEENRLLNAMARVANEIGDGPAVGHLVPPRHLEVAGDDHIAWVAAQEHDGVHVKQRLIADPNLRILFAPLWVDPSCL